MVEAATAGSGVLGVATPRETGSTAVEAGFTDSNTTNHLAFDAVSDGSAQAGRLDIKNHDLPVEPSSPPATTPHLAELLEQSRLAGTASIDPSLHVLQLVDFQGSTATGALPSG